MTRAISLLTAVLLVAGGTAGEARAQGNSNKHSKHQHSKTWSIPGGGNVFVMSGSAHGRLGAQVQNMTEDLRVFFGAPKNQGVLVGKVLPDTPAAKAGIKVGDVIISVNGDRIDGPFEIVGALAGKNKGDKVAVVVIRNKKRKTVRATLDDEGVGMAWSGLKGLSGLDDFNIDFDMPNLGSGVVIGGGGAMKKELEKTRKQLRELDKRLRKLEKAK